MPRPLREFSRPPLIEVVCGLQFAPLDLLTVHIGDFWQMVRDRYPSFEDHAPLADISDAQDRRLRIEQEHFIDNRERLSQSYARYFMRVGLPIDIRLPT